jgi:hypothetical protein
MSLSLGHYGAVSGHALELRQHAVVNPPARTAAVPRQVVGFITVTEDQETQSEVSELLEAGGVVTLKERVMQTAAFKTFQESITNRVRADVCHDACDLIKAHRDSTRPRHITAAVQAVPRLDAVHAHSDPCRVTVWAALA